MKVARRPITSLTNPMIGPLMVAIAADPIRIIDMEEFGILLITFKKLGKYPEVT